MNNKKRNLRITWEYPGGDGFTLDNIRSIVAYPDHVVISFAKTESLTLSTDCLTHIKKVEEVEEDLYKKAKTNLSSIYGMCVR